MSSKARNLTATQLGPRGLNQPTRASGPGFCVIQRRLLYHRTHLSTYPSTYASQDGATSAIHLSIARTCLSQDTHSDHFAKWRCALALDAPATEGPTSGKSVTTVVLW
jgi:hypothetical protein